MLSTQVAAANRAAMTAHPAKDSAFDSAFMARHSLTEALDLIFLRPHLTK
jgi:hypothetical protein